MFDTIESYYKCEHRITCISCEYWSICKMSTRKKYFDFEDLDELFTIHYAEGEI